MAFSSDSGGGPMADINVTPLVDVMLVLLIIFMVTAPILSYPIDVDLPQHSTEPAARGGTAAADPAAHRRRGQVFWNDSPTPISALPEHDGSRRSRRDPTNQPTLEIDTNARRRLRRAGQGAGARQERPDGEDRLRPALIATTGRRDDIASPHDAYQLDFNAAFGRRFFWIGAMPAMMSQARRRTAGAGATAVARRRRWRGRPARWRPGRRTALRRSAHARSTPRRTPGTRARNAARLAWLRSWPALTARPASTAARAMRAKRARAASHAPSPAAAASA